MACKQDMTGDQRGKEQGTDWRKTSNHKYTDKTFSSSQTSI